MDTPEPQETHGPTRVTFLFQQAALTLQELAEEVAVIERRFRRAEERERTDTDYIWDAIHQLGQLRNETEERAYETAITFHDFAIMDLGLVGVALKPLLNELQALADARDEQP